MPLHVAGIRVTRLADLALLLALASRGARSGRYCAEDPVARPAVLAVLDCQSFAAESGRCALSGTSLTCVNANRSRSSGPAIETRKCAWSQFAMCMSDYAERVIAGQRVVRGGAEPPTFRFSGARITVLGR